MRRTYRRKETFELDLNSLMVSKVVILPDEASGKLFMERIFPLFPGCFVCTADKSFPRDPELRDWLFHQIATKEDLAIVSFSVEVLHEIEIASDRILSVDIWLALSSPGYEGNREEELALDEHKIVSLMRSFFQQWRAMSRKGNWSHYYRNSREVDQAKLGWMMGLITRNGSTGESS